jgi:hypothetical protein
MAFRRDMEISDRVNDIMVIKNNLGRGVGHKYRDKKQYENCIFIVI